MSHFENGNTLIYRFNLIFKKLNIIDWNGKIYRRLKEIHGDDKCKRKYKEETI